MKQIVMLSPGFPMDESDTKTLPYLQTYILSLQQLEPNIKIRVVSLEYPKKRKVYIWHNITIYPLGIERKGLLKKLQAWQAVFKKIQALNRVEKIDILHSFWLFNCALIGHWLSKKLNIKHITTAMGVDVLPAKNRYLKFLPLQKMNLVTLSDFQDQQLKASYKNVITSIIPWGIKQEAILIQQERAIDILAVGDINSIKNYPFFIEVMKTVIKKNPSIKAYVIGRDLSKGKIAKTIDTLGLASNIQLLGVLPNETVLKYMKKSKILVHTSNYESLGYVFLEALKCGMQIVSRRVGIATTLNQWMIAEDIPFFVTAIERSLTNTAPRKSLVPFPIEKTVAAYAELYENL